MSDKNIRNVIKSHVANAKKLMEEMNNKKWRA